ncbi:nuclear transport factor 2 family protein [Brevundimonas variabilis]|uniref:SnoaL-like domain-containing protein n=1 Tax=Brevundimonas variabilis TaxID=74312 RepID=A0A7W9CHQ6_9CAUL|nr:nuclear transport factor 2 family protein [Brevundimonas variabilis]MBB5745741.1 hypothetical protein [Brevundimonas variabilis]
MPFTALLLALALQETASAPGPEAPDPAAVEVGTVIDQLHEAASRADGPLYFSLFTPDARFIGTDATERWSLGGFRAYAEPYFAKGQGWTYLPRDRVITFAPVACHCVAAFDEILDNASYGSVRGSGVLVRTETGWKIEQYVLSYAIPNDLARPVTALIREHEAAASPAAPSSDR